MTVGEAKPIASGPAGRRAPRPRRRPDQRDSPAAGEYDLSFNTTAFNSTQTPAQVVAAEFAKVLESAGIANPTSRFEIVGRPRADADVRRGGAEPGPPDRPRARRRPGAARQAQGVAGQTTATCSSSGSPTSAAPSPARPGPSP